MLAIVFEVLKPLLAVAGLTAVLWVTMMGFSLINAPRVARSRSRAVFRPKDEV
jgi:hypothetical protein